MANDKAKQERTIEVQVAKRKSVDLDGKVYGPGSKIVLPLSEAKALHDMGFIVEPDDDEVEQAGAASDAGNGPTVQTDDPAQ